MLIAGKIKRRVTLLDAIILLLLLAAGGLFLYRINVVLDYEWNWGIIPQYIFRFDSALNRWTPNLIMQGFMNTVRLSLWSSILATIAGVGAGILSVSRNRYPRMLAATYVEFVRNIPPLVLIFIFYFILSDQLIPALSLDSLFRPESRLGREMLTLFFAPPDQAPTFLVAVLTLALFEGAYISEIVRAGINSVNSGQWEASAALGMSRFKQMRLVILPQALPRVLPPMAGQYISTIKDSAIVSVISIQELTFQGMELMSATYLTFEVWITITVLYFVLTFTCSQLINRLEKKLRSRYY